MMTSLAKGATPSLVLGASLAAPAMAAESILGTDGQDGARGVLSVHGCEKATHWPGTQ